MTLPYVPHLPKYPQYDWEPSRKTASQADLARLDAAVATWQPQYDAARRQALEELETERRAKLAAEEAAAAKQKAAYEGLYARLPDGLRARHADGYASEIEIRRAIRRLIRQEAGYLPTCVQTSEGGGWEHAQRLLDMTDEEYARLVDIRAKAPEGAKVEGLLVWDGFRGYREATDADDPDDIDEDGEAWCDGHNVRRIVAVTWSRGGVKTSVGFPL